jgi:hypothetical protein
LKKLFASIIISLFLVNNVLAATLHVGSGQTYSTIAAAIAAQSPGDTIIIHSGTYPESSLTPYSGPDSTHYTTLIGASGETKPIINGATAQQRAIFNISNVNNIILDGLDIQGGGGLECGSGVGLGCDYLGGEGGTGHGGGPADNIIIQNCRISGANTTPDGDDPAQIWLSYGGSVTNVIIRNNELISSNGLPSPSFGIKGIDSASSTVNLLITNNYIHGGVCGIGFKWEQNMNTDSDRNITVQNNWIQNVSQRGIYADQAYLKILNNIIDGSKYGIFFGDSWGGDFCQVKHNTILNSSSDAYYFSSSSASNNNAQDNLRWSVSTIALNGNTNTIADMTTQPTFVGGASPSTVAGYTLTSLSNGYKAASDGKDFGADTTQVGIQSSARSSIGKPVGNNRWVGGKGIGN